MQITISKGPQLLGELQTHSYSVPNQGPSNLPSDTELDSHELYINTKVSYAADDLQWAHYNGHNDAFWYEINIHPNTEYTDSKVDAKKDHLCVKWAAI